MHDALLYTLKPAEDVTLTFLIKANVILDKSALTLDEAQPTKTLEDKASVHYEDEHGSHIITALQARLMKMVSTLCTARFTTSHARSRREKGKR